MIDILEHISPAVSSEGMYTADQLDIERNVRLAQLMELTPRRRETFLLSHGVLGTSHGKFAHVPEESVLGQLIADPIAGGVARGVLTYFGYMESDMIDSTVGCIAAGEVIMTMYALQQTRRGGVHNIMTGKLLSNGRNALIWYRATHGGQSLDRYPHLGYSDIAPEAFDAFRSLGK
jgi:hypothetical protein